MLEGPSGMGGVVRLDRNGTGMTLRDYFAGQVLGQMLAQEWGNVGMAHLPRTVAVHAYKVADAMLDAREKAE